MELIQIAAPPVRSKTSIQIFAIMLFGHYILIINIFGQPKYTVSTLLNKKEELEMKTYKWLGYFAVGLVALSLVAVTVYKSPRAYADDKVFSDLIMQAEVWSVGMMTPPDAYRAKSDITNSVIQNMHDSQTAVINNIFTGDYKKSAQEIVDTNYSNAGYNRALGGGVNSITINNLSVTGGSAIADVTVSKYIELKVTKDGKLYCGKTQGTGNDTFYFTQENGQWKISRLKVSGPTDDTTFTMTPIVP